MTIARRSHQIWYLAGISICCLLFTGRVFAQEATPPAREAEPIDSFEDLAYPVAELGSCVDAGSCISYCEDPVHHTECADFAKKKGFYKSDELHAANEAFWIDAQTALGCNSLESCSQLCQQTTNHEKCDAYARQKGIVGGYVDEPDKPEYLQIAKEVLGCDSATGCRSFCDDPANATACNAFAKRVGLLGGAVVEGPGGCTSPETCSSFCRDPNNFDSCRVYAPPGTGTFQGPGGCDNKSSCRSYCEEHPLECRSYAPGSNGVYVPVSCPSGQYFGPGGVCTPTEKTQEATQCAGGGKFWNGSSCQDTPPPGVLSAATTNSAYFQPRSDMGNCKTPGECYDWCKENPGKCGGFRSDAPRPDDTYIPSLYYTPGTPVTYEARPEMGNCKTPGACYDWCKENPGKCGGFEAKSPRPVDTYAPGTYYTPPADYVYYTPPTTHYYVTPVYYTPSPGSDYTTPSYYTPGYYATPSYYTPPPGSDYTTPSYYTPGYYTPIGGYTTPTYYTPQYYTPPPGSDYTTPTYYTPPPYTSPYYYTPSNPNYTTPTYNTPPPYNTPTYNTPYDGGNYTTPVYYTPPIYSTPQYYTPSDPNYTTPTYHTPPTYSTPNYYTPSYYTPSGTYATPTYYTPSGDYTTPTYYTPSGTYGTPSYGTPAYGTPSYGTPAYGTPSYGTPAYNTPSYETPTYGTPSYDTPSYGTPSYETPSYGTPGAAGDSTQGVAGVATSRSWWETFLGFLGFVPK